MFHRGTVQLAILSALSGLACSLSPSVSGLLDREVSAVEHWLGAASARTLSPPKRSEMPSGRSASWRTEADVSWDSLVSGLQARPPYGFERCHTKNRGLICVQTAHGDSTNVYTRVEEEGPPLRLIVTVTAMAW